MSKTKYSSADLLQGPMLGKMLVFALPLALGSILQQLFNAVDVAVVGQFASSEALAAVGANTPVVTLLVNLFVGISVGSNVVIANYIGRGENKRIGSAVHTSVAVAVISGIFLMVLGLLIAKPLLTLISTPEDIIDMAVLYLRIYCIGMPFIIVYNFGAAILRSIGDTKRPLLCLVVAGVVNAVLNLFFVIVCHMSVSGVAIATVISNVISTGMMVRFLLQADEIIRLDIRKLGIQKKELQQILKIGVPAGLQGMVFSIANVCIQASINGFGASAVAGSSITSNFEMISFYTINGYNSAVMTFVSQNMGAGNWKRCRQSYLVGMGCAVATAAIADAVFTLARNPLIGIFTSDPEVAYFAVQRMFYVVMVHFLICSYEITGSALRGLGRSLLPTILTVFGTCILRIIYVNTYVVAHHEFKNLMMIYPISWCLTGTMTITAFWIVWHRMKKEI